jgi:glycosyltransferase involved in cell wall biosynthesis
LRDANVLAATRAKYKTSDHFVLAVCNMQPRKNLVRLMQAFARAKHKYALPHKLVLAGQRLWLTAEVLAQARRLGEDVVLTGYVPDADLPLLYNAADVFAYPSLYEGFGLPVLEAMACGTPVITSNVSSLPEVSGDAARLVDPYDLDDIASAIFEIVRDIDVRTAWQVRGLARARLFTWERTAEQTVQIYHLTARALRAPPTELSGVPVRLRD